MKKSDDKELKNIEELQKSADEWKSKYLRALADYQNLEKRIAANRHDDRLYAGSHIVRELLPVTDVLTKAQEHLNDQGLGLALKELWKVLQEQGVSRIDVGGREFDPEEMECVEVAEGKDNKVIEEIVPGYRLHDRILRVAKVKVGKENTSKKIANDSARMEQEVQEG